MTVQTVLAIALLVSAVIGAAYSVGKAGVWLWRTLRALARLADDLTGEPDRPGAPGRKGVLDRLEAIEVHLQRLDRFEERLAALEASLATAVEH